MRMHSQHLKQILMIPDQQEEFLDKINQTLCHMQLI